MSRYHLRRINIPPNRGSSNPDVIVLLDKDSVKFGRNPDQVDIVLNSALYNNMISREHAEIVRRRNADGSTAYYLLDKSLNGTYVKSIRAHGPVLLHAGDIIHFGHINGAAINPGEAAPQPDAEFTYVFEKSQRVSPVQPGIQAAQMFPTNAPGGQNLYAPYQHQAGGAQFNPYSFGGGGHPAIMSHLGLAAAYGNLGSMLPPNMSAAYAAAQLGAAHQQVLSSAHHPAGPETVGLNMPGGHNWMSYGGAQNQPRGVPQQQKPMASGFRYPQAVVSQPSDFVMGGGGQSAFRHAYFNRDGSEMSDPANTLANLHHQQVLMNNSANQQQLGLSRNPVVTTQQQQQSVVNRSQIGSQPELKAHVGSGGLPPQQQFLNRPYGGGDPNVSPFDRQNLGNFPGIPQNTSLPPTEMRPCMSDNTTKPEGMASVIMPNLSVAGRDVKSEYFQPSCSIPNDSINHMSPLSALAEVAKRQTDSQPIVSRPRSVAEVPTKIEQNSTAKLDLKDVTTPQQPLKMECDSSVPSPPRVHTTEVVESADINQELLSLARKCVTSHSPAEEMFDLDTEINQKADLSKSPVTTRLPDDSGNDSSGRSSRPKQKLNEVARLLNDISSSSFMFNVRKKCGEISSSSGSSSDDDNDKDSDADDKSEGEKKSKKGKDKGDSQKSSTPTSIKSPGSQKGRVKSPAKKSQSPDAKKDKVETKVAQKPTQSDSSASESSSEEDKSDEDESDSSVDRRKKTAKKPVVKKGTTVTRATPKSSDTPQSASGAKGQRKRAEPPSSHLSTGPKGAEGRKGKGSSRADLSSDEEEDQISSNSDSDYDKPIAKKQRKSASSKRNSSPVTKKSKSKATGTTSAKRSRKTSATKPTKQRKRKQKNSSDDDDVDADSDEPALTSLHNPDVPCAAQKKCRKPQSANVEWIACDDCDKWFHVECADCDPEAAKQERFQFHCGCDE